MADMIRRFTVETSDDGMAVGHAAFHPKLAGEWRFAREAVLDWLARR